MAVLPRPVIGDHVPPIPEALTETLGQRLTPLGFSRMPGDVVWKKKTWNVNRGVALVAHEGRDHPGETARFNKAWFGGMIGFVPALYTLGLQIVIVTRGVLPWADDLDRYVDQANNFQVVLQNIHVVDLDRREAVSSRTWVQFATGNFYDAVHEALQRYLALPPSP